MLHFWVKGLFFTKKEPVAHRRRYSHSTTLILKNLRTVVPKIPHFTITKPHNLTPLFYPKFQLLPTSPLNSPISNKKYHPTKCKVIFLHTINFLALKPSTTKQYLKSHNLHILNPHICHYTLQGIIFTNLPINTPVQV